MNGPAFRLGLFYAAFFLIIGNLAAFWPVWMTHRGLGPAEIGMVMAAASICKALANPVLAHAADRSGERRRWIMLLAAAAFLAYLPFQWTHGFWPILVLHLVFFAAFSPTMPLVESLTMLGARQQGLDYGRIRLWGSLTFIVAVTGGGLILEGRSPEVIYWMMLAAVALTALAALAVPDFRAPPATQRGLPLGAAFRTTPGFVPFLAAAALIQSAHAVYYGFGTLNWLRAGYSETVIGLLWAEGVVAEIGLFIIGTRVVRRWGPATLIAIGGAAGAVRWIISGLTDDLGIMFAVQLLHAITFGATHLGAIHFIAERVKPEYSASAQSFYAVTVGGLAMGAASFGAGFLYEAYAGRAYLAMAVLCVVGGCIALTISRRPPAAAP